MKRRSLLKGMAAASLGPVLASCSIDSDTANKRKLDKIGIQLYTVRDLMEIDVPNTLSQLANIGYREMEFAGYFNHSPKEIRLFQCFMCKENYVYPYKSKDYVACNNCFKGLYGK